MNAERQRNRRLGILCCLAMLGVLGVFAWLFFRCFIATTQGRLPWPEMLGCVLCFAAHDWLTAIERRIP